MPIEDNTGKQPDEIESENRAETSDVSSSGQSENDVIPPRRSFWQFRVWLKRGFIPLMGLLASIGIILGVFFFYRYNPDIFDRLETWGYLGVFLIAIFFNATIVLPLGSISVIISMGGTLPSPLLVGLVGGAGAAIGELTGYLAGRSGQGLFKKSRLYLGLEKWVKKWGWIAVFLMSAFPAIFDIVGLIAGALRMPLWRFFLACVGGRIISYIIIAYTADMGFDWFLG